MKITIDFETRSECDLRRTGAWEYSLHPTTEVICNAFTDQFAQDIGSFFISPSLADELNGEWAKYEISRFRRILSNQPNIEAHNAGFEFAIWHNIMVPRYGWPVVPLDRWYCSAAKAASRGLPRSLDGATSALGLSEVKDKAGHRLMMQLCKPRPKWKSEGTGDKYFGTPEKFEQLRRYCEQDVRAEVALSDALPELSAQERRIWCLDQTINRRGVHCDLPLIDAAIELAAAEAERGKAAMSELTDGAVTTPNQVAKLRDWVNTVLAVHWRHLEALEPKPLPCPKLPDISAGTVKKALTDGSMPGCVRKALELRQAHSKSSVKKYQAMRDRAGADARIRETLLYHGAHTGRWTGMAIQPQNFVKPTVPWYIIEDVLIPDILTGDTQSLRIFAGSVGEALASTLRSALCAGPGNDLIGADYASIEARVLLWLANDQAGLEIIRSGKSLYIDMASTIYGAPYDSLTKKSPEYPLGKVAILGLGYQMGAMRFCETCEAWGVKLIITKRLKHDIFLTDLASKLRVKKANLKKWIVRNKPESITSGSEYVAKALADQLLESKRIVDVYRAKYKKVVALWYMVQDAAIKAVAGEGPQHVARCVFTSTKQWLTITLPSGRKLHYREPKLKPNEFGGLSLSHMGVNSLTKKWERQSTYGGKLVENIDQAASRDFMAEAMLRCEAKKYWLVMDVHDELIAEVPIDFGSLAEFIELLTTKPLWAAGCPIAAEGWRGKRYRK